MVKSPVSKITTEQTDVHLEQYALSKIFTLVILYFFREDAKEFLSSEASFIELSVAFSKQGK